MTQHTPGPWGIRPVGNKGDFGIYTEVQPWFYSGTIARIPYKENRPQRENARLIAACPDLLAVAEEVINNQEALPAYLVTMAIHAVGRAKG